MTPEEIEELRALAGRLSGTAYNENLAAILGAALEHIHKQDARISELEGDLEQEEHNSEAFMNKIGEHVCEIVDLETKIAELEASLDEAAALTKKNVGQINALLVQVAALQEIAEEERAKYNLSWKDCAHRAPDTYCEKTHNYCTLEDCPLLEGQKTEARRQLSEEHPEAFR